MPTSYNACFWTYKDIIEMINEIEWGPVNRRLYNTNVNFLI